jgi:hypothetical protein
VAILTRIELAKARRITLARKPKRAPALVAVLVLLALGACDVPLIDSYRFATPDAATSDSAVINKGCKVGLTIDSLDIVDELGGRFVAVSKAQGGGYVAAGEVTVKSGSTTKQRGLARLFDGKGAVSWSQVYVQVKHDLHLTDIAPAISGGFFIAGHRVPTDGTSGEALVLQVDSAGQQTGLMLFGTAVRVNAIAMGAVGTFFVTGAATIVDAGGAFVAKNKSVKETNWLTNGAVKERSVEALGIMWLKGGDSLAVGVARPLPGAADSVGARAYGMYVRQAGKLEWAKMLADDSVTDYVDMELFGITVNENDVKMVVGRTTGANKVSRSYLAKLVMSADGAKLNGRSPTGGTKDRLRAVISLNGGDFLAVGTSDGAGPHKQGAIVRFDADTNNKWLRTVGPKTAESLLDVVDLGDGTVVAVGQAVDQTTLVKRPYLVRIDTAKGDVVCP